MKDNKYLNVIICAIAIVFAMEVIVFVTAMNYKNEVIAVNNEINIVTNISKKYKDVIIEKYKSGLSVQIDENLNQNTSNEVANIENQVEPKEFYIKVNYQENVVTIYIKDEDGKFTKPYKAMVCSTGVATPTSGVYKMSDRGKWGMMVGNVWAQYYSRICGAILFHSVPYTSKSPSTLEYWEYDKLGTTASAGCVRLTVEDAKWIYEHCKAGTKVEFYADSDPGPLGKPVANKIAEAGESVRGWDPTDPDEKNPWKYY